MTTVCIHQPDFMPWLGFFHRLIESDVFVILDNVQFIRRGWQNRDRIKTAQGTQWLTVPVVKKGRYDQLIRDVEIDESTDWRGKHLKTLEASYRRAAHFSETFHAISKIYERRHHTLMEFNLDLIGFFNDAFGISVTTHYASELEVSGSRTALLVGLTQAVGGSTYLSGLGAKAYLEEDRFEAAGIKVAWQDFPHPVYPQLHGEFVEGMSAIDALFIQGREVSTLIGNRASA